MFKGYGQRTDEHRVGFAIPSTSGYTGHRLDRELNHYYSKYRYYNPTTMRWLSRDPLGMVDGPNVYAYVRENVVNAVVQKGLYAIRCVKWGEMQLVWMLRPVIIDRRFYLIQQLEWQRPCIKYKPIRWWSKECNLEKDLAKCQIDY